MENADELVLVAAAEKMRAAQISPSAIASFEHGLRRLMQGDSGLLPDALLSEELTVPDLVESRPSSAFQRDLLERLVVIKLNGGLGTSMGLERAKSLLTVKGNDTFLDLIVRQIQKLRGTGDGLRPGFFLMNSFSTRSDTLDYLHAHHPWLAAQGPFDFLQGKVPKLEASTLRPVVWPQNPALEWCPPGHGDIYPSLVDSGLLADWLGRGFRYAFVSNADNLGATVDPGLLAYFAESNQAFLMEVARRTSADRKGGHLARRRADGRLVLRESAQCPPSDAERFQDVERHRYFNTNNLWLRLDRLEDAIRRNGGALPLPIIANRKTVDPGDRASTPVIQVETAMGAAIECFEPAGAVCVPRSRFAPVKTTADLLAVRSDAYEVAGDASLQLIARRNGVPPVIQLEDRCYKTLPEFETHFAAALPSLADCVSLTVSGSVMFAPGVVCRGQVRFHNPASDSWTVPAGCYESGEYGP